MKFAPSIAAICIAAAGITSVANASGPVFATYAGPQLGVTERSNDLVQQDFFATGLVASGISVTPNSRIYVSAQNNLLEYAVGGALVNSMTFPDVGINYSAIHATDSGVFATYTGSQQGITLRDNGLVQTSFIATGVDATGITVTPGNAIYITAANGIYEYDFAGSLLNSMIFPDPQILYTDIDYGYGLLFAAYSGSQQGFSVRDLALNQLGFYGVNFDISGLAVGDNNNLFLSSGNNLYEYSTSGLLLNSFTFPNPGIEYTAIAFRSAVPEPASWAMLIAGFGLVGGAMRRRTARTAIA